MDFSKTWSTAYFHGRTLRRAPGMFDANSYDVQTDEEFWVSRPKRDRTDTRYGPPILKSRRKPSISITPSWRARALPGRENG